MPLAFTYIEEWNQAESLSELREHLHGKPGRAQKEPPLPQSVSEEWEEVDHWTLPPAGVAELRQPGPSGSPGSVQTSDIVLNVGRHPQVPPLLPLLLFSSPTTLLSST